MTNGSRISEIKYTAKLLAFAKPTGHIYVPPRIGIVNLDRGDPWTVAFTILKGEELDTLYKEFFANDLVEVFDLLDTVYAIPAKAWLHIAELLETRSLVGPSLIKTLRMIAQMVDELEEE